MLLGVQEAKGGGGFSVGVLLAGRAHRAGNECAWCACACMFMPECVRARILC